MRYDNDERLNLNVWWVCGNDDDSYDNNFMLGLTFAASTISDCSDHGIWNDKRLQEKIHSRLTFLSPSLSLSPSNSGDDVPGGEEAGPQGPGGAERAGEVAQSHQDHRLRPGEAAGHRREGVQRGRGQGWCKWRREHVSVCVQDLTQQPDSGLTHRAAFIKTVDISSKYCKQKVIKQKVFAPGLKYLCVSECVCASM